MKVLHISTSDIDGGAARSAYRLHSSLREIGVESSMFVAQRSSQDDNVQLFEAEHRLRTRLSRNFMRRRIEKDWAAGARTRPPGLDHFSDDRTYRVETTRQLPPADIINLHWVSGLIGYEDFFSVVPLRTPVVWTIHDMNAFTGGCHYNAGCERYMIGCGACPQLGSSRINDLSKSIWDRKKNAFSSVADDHLQIVGPSQWLAREVRQSTLLGRFGVSVIPYGLDLQDFAPRDRAFARNILKIPKNAHAVLFASDLIHNRRKGLSLLLAALEKIKNVDNLWLCSVGKGDFRLPLRFPHVHLGSINHDRFLSLIYSACDVFAIPSLEDNLPNTVLESIACGTPVVGFEVGGIPDMVRPGQTGLLVPLEDVEGLSQALSEVLNNNTLRQTMQEKCRQVAEAEYEPGLQARRYRDLYERTISDWHV